MSTERPLIESQAAQSTLFGLIRRTGYQVHVNRYLRDADSFQIGDAAVSAYLIPGHTKGSAAYLIGGALYLGDSADASRNGQLLPAKRFLSEDPAQNRASLVRLADELKSRSSEIKFLEFAHSGPWLHARKRLWARIYPCLYGMADAV